MTSLAVTSVNQVTTSKMSHLKAFVRKPVTTSSVSSYFGLNCKISNECGFPVIQIQHRSKSNPEIRLLNENITFKNHMYRTCSSIASKSKQHAVPHARCQPFSFVPSSGDTKHSKWASFLSNMNWTSHCQVRNFSSTRQAWQRSNIGGSMPQVDAPGKDVFPERLQEPGRIFRGLETDFPCLSEVKDTGPEPAYHNVTTGYKLYRTGEPFQLRLNNGVLPQLDMAYETWGELNDNRDNAIIVLAGMSASSHARSSVDNMRPGWWERFVGPGCAVDTSKFFVICPNNFGGCYGSSGPSSINELTGKPYGTTFPIITIEDMTNAMFLLLDYLGIDKLYAAVGSSLGGMLSLQSAASFPDRVGRLISISSCAQSHPSSIAMRYLQRKCIMVDPNWNKGHYYDQTYPKVGMKLAREIATITYRSGPEWGKRFARGRINKDEPVSLCPTFLIESYLEHQGETFSTIYDPNSLLYLSKAMDMYDIGEGFDSLEEGVSRIKCPVMVVGVQTDILFPIWQQRQLAKALQDCGNEQVTFYELNSIYGHDTFLLDLNGVGAAVKGFLETEQSNTGIISKHKLKEKEQKPACPMT